MIVKICGITTLDDAISAAEAGADILGYNFFRGSPRFLPPDRCREIQDGLISRGLEIQTAGIFVDTPIEEIIKIRASCGFGIIQHSGNATPELVELLGGKQMISIREPTYEGAIRRINGYGNGRSGIRYLFDRNHPLVYGGSGEIGDWVLARDVARRFPVILAGGLNPENVRRAVEEVRPWGVDVASGVEAAPGRKDPVKMQAFVRAAKLAGGGPRSR